MHELSVVVDSSSDLDAIRTQLRNIFDLRFFAPDQIEEIKPECSVVFDVNIPACPDILKIKT